MWSPLLSDAECAQLLQRALAARPSDTLQRGEQRMSSSVSPLIEAQGGSSCLVPHPHNRSRLGVFCVALDNAQPQFFVMDAVCFHAGGDLCSGPIVAATIDIEDLACERRDVGRLCVQCPQHGYLFSLATGDNVIASPVFRDGRMSLGGLKAVRGMQRVYRSVYVEGEGLSIDAAGEGRYASDRAK